MTGRRSDPFDSEFLLSPDDIACEELRLLVKVAGLNAREAQIWLTHQLSQIAPYAVNNACSKPLTQHDLAELLGCSPQYINKLFVAARKKIAAFTEGAGYVVAGPGRVCPEEIPCEPSTMEGWASQLRAGEFDAEDFC